MRFELATDTANVTRIKVIGVGGGGNNVAAPIVRESERGQGIGAEERGVVTV